MKKVLVTGSNGLLGQKLTAFLSKREDYEVIATSKGENRMTIVDEYTYLPLDITQQHQVEIILNEIQPDVVFNTAAMTNVDACEEHQDGCRALNVDAVSYLIQACLKCNAHLIHISTDFVFDGEDGPYAESDRPNPVSFYGQSKLDAEKLVAKSGLKKWAILRTVLLYGVIPNASRSNVVLWAKGALSKGDPMRVVNDQFRSPTLAEDLATACILVSDKGKSGIYHISGPETMSIIELVNRVGEFYDFDVSHIETVSSSTLNQAAQRPPKTGFILDKARKELGYDPHSFEEGLQIVEGQLSSL